MEQLPNVKETKKIDQVKQSLYIWWKKTKYYWQAMILDWMEQKKCHHETNHEYRRKTNLDQAEQSLYIWGIKVTTTNWTRS
jgi:hypothetical protein